MQLFEVSEMSGALRTALGSEKSKKNFAIMMRPDGYVRHGGIVALRADDRLKEDDLEVWKAFIDL